MGKRSAILCIIRNVHRDDVGICICARGAVPTMLQTRATIYNGYKTCNHGVSNTHPVERQVDGSVHDTCGLPESS